MDFTKTIEMILKRIELQKKDNAYVGCCPFHSDESRSFSINLYVNRYYCFVCKREGDIRLLIDMIDRPQAAPISDESISGKILNLHVKKKSGRPKKEV